MNKICRLYYIQFSLLLCLFLIFSVAVPVEADQEEEHHQSSERSEPTEPTGSTDENYLENVDYESPRSEEFKADTVTTDHRSENDDPVPFTGEQQPLIFSLAESSPTMQKIDDYWVIETFAHLNEVREALNDKYLLANDITIPEKTNWDPIGLYHANPFAGVFDGAGFTISGLMTDKNLAYAGFFGYVKNATIVDLHVREVSINAGSGNHIGGLVGRADNSFIENCSVTGSIESKGNNIGGIAGSVDETSVKHSFADCEVKGSSASVYVGGLIGGVFYHSSIENSYSVGSVIGGDHLGGLIGRVSGKASDISSGNLVENCYTSTIVIGGGVNVGGLLGSIHSRSKSENSYWDQDVSDLSHSASGNGRTTAQMKFQDNYTGWDFANTWFIEEGVSYPSLRWQIDESPLNPDDPDEPGSNPGENDGDGDGGGGPGGDDDDDSDQPGDDDNDQPGDVSNDYPSDPTMVGNGDLLMMFDQTARFNSDGLFLKLLSMIRQLEQLIALMLETGDYRQAYIHAEIDLLFAEITELFETNRYRLSSTEEKIILEKLESIAAVLAAD